MPDHLQQIAILTYSAYLMYRCYHLKQEISKKRSNCLIYSDATLPMLLLHFVTIVYDWRTGNGKYTISANGHCYIVDNPSYNTLIISTSITAINKIIQFTMLLAYLFYLYKFNMNAHSAGISLQYN